MKVLESSPDRYDRGVEMLSHGRIGQIYELIAETVAGEGRAILDIGCGTGNVSLECARRGATVVGIDIDPGMLEVAERKAENEGLSERISFLEIGVGEMKSRFKESTMDACVSCLAFSELTSDERSYAIASAHSILKPHGTMVIADETRPRSATKRLFRSIIQLPVRALTYILTQSSTHPLGDISSELRQAGFVEIETKRLWGDTFMVIVAHRGDRE